MILDRGQGKKVTRRLGLAILLSAISLPFWSCQLVGGGGPTQPTRSPMEVRPIAAPEGTFQGFIEIEGGRVDGTLTLTAAGVKELECFFESPPDLVAMGRGRIQDGELRMELSYEGACPGRMILSGRWESASGNLTGVVNASDCTGNAEGTFLFQPG